MSDRNLTDADVNAIVLAQEVARKQVEAERRRTGDESRFSDEEAEWLHTANKYIPSKLLPMAGRMVSMCNETAYSVGKAVIKFMFIASGGGIVLFIMHKAGLLK